MDKLKPDQRHQLASKRKSYEQIHQRGAFITLEGIEGAGKSSCVPAIEGFLEQRNIEFLVTREPGGTPLAEDIRNLVLGIGASQSNEAPTPETETLLMFASRAQHLGMVIRPALERGCWVICDRYTDATLAYQGAARNIGTQRIRDIANWLHPDVWPDKTFLFDVSVKTGSSRATKRGSKDRIERERAEFFERVRSSYLKIAEEEPMRVHVVNAEQSMTAVADDVLSELERFIEERQ